MDNRTRRLKNKINNQAKRIRTVWKLYRLLRAVQPYTMVDHSRLILLHGLASEAVGLVKGDVVECGVCNGGSAAVLATAVRDAANSKLFLYDTFDGIPAPSLKDGQFAPKFEGSFKGSIDAVKEVMGKVKFPSERVVIRRGLFRDTFRDDGPPERVALLHIDSDWYDSVLLSLQRFYPLIPLGGIVVLDDFGYWEGAREAFYDYCREQGLKPLIERVGPWQAFWRKGREVNRDIGMDYKPGIYWPQPLHLKRPMSLLSSIIRSS